MAQEKPRRITMFRSLKKSTSKTVEKKWGARKEKVGDRSYGKGQTTLMKAAEKEVSKGKNGSGKKERAAKGLRKIVGSNESR